MMIMSIAQPESDVAHPEKILSHSAKLECRRGFQHGTEEEIFCNDISFSLSAFSGALVVWDLLCNAGTSALKFYDSSGRLNSLHP